MRFYCEDLGFDSKVAFSHLPFDLIIKVFDVQYLDFEFTYLQLDSFGLYMVHPFDFELYSILDEGQEKTIVRDLNDCLSIWALHLFSGYCLDWVLQASYIIYSIKSSSCLYHCPEAEYFSHLEFDLTNLHF